MEKWIGWVIAGAAGIAAAVYFVVSGSSPTPVTDLCLKDLPAPFNKQATDVIAKGDAALMQSFATQCDVKGWHCAAKELRAKAADLDVAKRTKLDILDVAKSATEPLRSQVGKALMLFVKPKLEDPTYEKVVFSKPPSDADIKLLDSLSANLKAAGYANASLQMSHAADRARDFRIVSAERAATCADAIDKLPHDMPFHFGSSDTFNPPSPQAWARAGVEGKDATAMSFIADYFDALGAEVDKKISEGTSIVPAGAVYHNAASCIRSLSGGTSLIFPVA